MQDNARPDLSALPGDRFTVMTMAERPSFAKATEDKDARPARLRGRRFSP